MAPLDGVRLWPIRAVHQIRCEQCAEPLRELRLGAAVLPDEEALEYGLIQTTTNAALGSSVGGAAVNEERHAFGERLLDHSEVEFRGIEEPLGRLQLLADAVLLGLEKIDRDGLSVVRFEEFPSLLPEVCDSRLGSRRVSLCDCLPFLHLLIEQFCKKSSVALVNRGRCGSLELRTDADEAAPDGLPSLGGRPLDDLGCDSAACLVDDYDFDREGLRDVVDPDDED